MRVIRHVFACVVITKCLPYETLLAFSILIENIYLQAKLFWE
ncbi:putative membrane protein [Chlamydia psittaci 10_743_SC13]|nr:putative membrane protein [Chlamydia psittaci 10_743_SC13]